MIRVPLHKIKDSLSQYLRQAEQEDIIITRHGVPAGILIGFENPDEWWEELLLRHPQFQARVAQARENLRAGRGRTIEEVREKYAAETSAEAENQ